MVKGLRKPYFQRLNSSNFIALNYDAGVSTVEFTRFGESFGVLRARLHTF